MQFLVIAHDSEDDQASARRLAVREEHLEAARLALEAGTMLIGGAILDGGGRMVGSMTVVSLPDRDAFDTWLNGVPYMRHGVSDRVEVHRYQTQLFKASSHKPRGSSVAALKASIASRRSRSRLTAARPLP